MSWDKGRDAIQRMLNLSQPELELVEPNEMLVTRLLQESDAHIASAKVIVENDPPGAFQLGYDAARKACESLLAAQGLRSTREGGHVAVSAAVRAQFNGSNGILAFRELDNLRRLRADSQYPRKEVPPITLSDAKDLLARATAIVEAAKTLVGSGKLEPFR